MPKTLIIDDDPAFENCIRDHFGGGKGNPTDGDVNNFIFAHNSAEALTIMSEQTDEIDIVAVTIDSDDIGGLGIFQRLTDTNLRVPRIALTSSRDLSAIRTAMNQGAVDFLTKPVEISDLLATLKKVYADCEDRRGAWKAESQLAAIRREMDLAGSIQKRILPQTFPNSGNMDVYAQTAPAQEMGGDFYDFFDMPGGKTALVVADVSGKGVPAAFYMAVVRTLFRAAAPMSKGPADCLNEVNRMLVSHDIPGMFVTVFYGILDGQSGALHYANAGHLPPYLVSSDGTIITVDSGGGVVLGFDHGVPYTEDQLVLNKGDGLFIYTDGLTEAFDKNRNQFSEQRLIDCLLENRHLSAQDLTTNVFAFVDEHTGDAPQSDDVTSLSIRRF